MITINLQYATPDELEAMLRMFWNASDSLVSRSAYRQLMAAYRNLTSREELDTLMDEIDNRSIGEAS